MPIQIRELVIRATVDEDSKSEDSSNGILATQTEHSESLVRQCVDEVLEILRFQNEP